jgi:energy-coupling factor transport system substrate-specific component
MQAHGRFWFTGVVVVGALVLNTGLTIVNSAFNLPFFLDSIGTAIAAAVVALPIGIAVAIATNLLQEVVHGGGGTNWPFALCGIATVLIVHGFVKAGRFATIGDAILASLLVAFANAVLGGIIATFVFGGLTGVGLDYLVTGLVAAGQSLVSAAFWARVPTNLFDKALAVFAAYALRAPLLRLRSLTSTLNEYREYSTD